MRQQEIDWQDASWRRAIAELPFPPNIPRIESDTLRAVLLALFEVGKGRPCWPGQDTLAELAGCSKRQVQEALYVLERRLGFIVSYRAQPPESSGTRRTLNHYVLIWTDIDRAIQRGNGSLRIDPDPLRIDPVSLRIDPDPLRIDPPAHFISARAFGKGKEKELPDPEPVGPQTVADEFSWATEEGTETRLQADNSSEDGFGADNPNPSLWSKVCLESDPRLGLPELQDARLRSVEPLPARWQAADGSWRDLRGSVFSAVKLDTLKRPSQLARWHRRQLSAASPYFGPTELDLLMILALARHAVSCPVEEIRRNRVAYWVHLSVRQKWTTGLRHLQWALAELESLRASAEQGSPGLVSV